MKKMKLLFTAMMTVAIVAIVALSVGCPNIATKPLIVATPTITITEGQSADMMDFSKQITITGTEVTEIFHYTIDGTTPTTTSKILTKGAVAKLVRVTAKSLGLPEGAASFTLKVMAVEEYHTNSAVATMTFTRATTLDEPVIGFSQSETIAGSIELTLTATNDADIHFTVSTSGEAPAISDASPKYDKNNKPSWVDPTTIKIKAIAVKNGYDTSGVVAATFARAKVETPTISPNGGMLTPGATTFVELKSATESAEIYYTTTIDGKPPAFPGNIETATKYTEPFEVTNVKMKIKAIAIKDGYTNSGVAESAAFTQEKVATPKITLSVSEMIRFVELTCDTEGAEIYYTIGTAPLAPTNKSIKYIDKFPTADAKMEIKAIAIHEDYANSLVKTATIYKRGALSKPVISPNAGSFNSVKTVTLKPATNDDAKLGLSIYYTTDGTTPTAIPNATNKMYFEPLKITKTTTVKAIAVHADYPNSGVVEAKFTIKLPVETPTISPDGGVIKIDDMVTLACATDGAEIYYTTTTDSTEPPNPTSTATKYTEPFKVTNVKMKIKAIAIKDGYTNSGVVESKAFTLGELVMLAIPSITPDKAQTPFAGNLQITLAAGATDTDKTVKIYYTTNGEDPIANESSSNKRYKTPFNLSSTKTVKAIAVQTGYANSAVASKLFTRAALAELAITSSEGDSFGINTIVTLTVGEVDTDKQNVKIYYTTNGNEPTASNTQYDDAFTITEKTTVKAIAIHPNYDNSPVASATFTKAGTPIIGIPKDANASAFDYTKEITFTGASKGAEYYYATNDSVNLTTGGTKSSDGKLFLNKLNLSPASPVTVYVIARTIENMSPVAEKKFIQAVVAKPTIAFTGSAGEFDYTQDITFESITEDVTYHYTVTGKDGTSTTTTPINLQTLGVTASPATVKVIAKRDGYADSEPITQEFTKKVELQEITLTMSDGRTTFDGWEELTLTVEPSNAILSYKFGSGTFQTYTVPVRIGDKLAVDGTITMHAKATLSGYSDKTIETTFTKTGLMKTVLVDVSDGSSNVSVPFQVNVNPPNDSGQLIKWVKLTKNYQMGVYEVTNGQYALVMDSEYPASGGDLPKAALTWLDAVKFCNALSTKEGLTLYYTINGTTVTIATDGDGRYSYRLPTEVEWEYAARGGQHRDDHSYKYSGTTNSPAQFAWFNKSSDGTQEVGLLAPNALGIYDMSGNVAEMCFDLWKDKKSYPLRGTTSGGGADKANAMVDPQGALSGASTVRRGGAFNSTNALAVMVSVRGSGGKSSTSAANGFRVVRTVNPEAAE